MSSALFNRSLTSIKAKPSKLGPRQVLGSFIISEVLDNPTPPISSTGLASTKILSLVPIRNDFKFIIEKSENGIDWLAFSEVQGFGNSPSEKKYASYDISPYPKYTFYRLKQIDFNGAHTYSDVIQVKIKEEAKKDLKVYPNPTSDLLYVELDLSNRLTPIRILNSLGTDVSELVRLTLEDNHSISLNVAMIPSGLYIIKTGTQSIRFYKK